MNMNHTFTEMFLFQVKPDKMTEFETLIHIIKKEQAEQTGCTGIRYFKRFYTFDGVELGEAPREITKIVKCIKYYAYWEFDTKENCGQAHGWLFEKYYKQIVKLLIAPFDINSGYSIG